MIPAGGLGWPRFSQESRDGFARRIAVPVGDLHHGRPE